MFLSRISTIAAMAAVLTTAVGADHAEVFLGSLTDNKDFDLAGDVYAVSDHVLEVRNFNYRGGAPDPFFWIDGTPGKPTNENGVILQESSPTASCGTAVIESTVQPQFAAPPTYRLEIPNGKSIHDFVGGTVSLWCRAMYVNLGSADIPASIDDNDVASLASATEEEELECQETEVDTFNLYDRFVKPVTYLLGGLWSDISNFLSSGADSEPAEAGEEYVDIQK